LELIADTFPGRPAFDVGVSRALLREVAAGRRSETLRLYRPEAVLAFSVSDLRRPGFSRAVAIAREHGFEPTLRLAGGAAALYHEQTLALAWCSPERDERRDIRGRFERLSAWLARALGRLGVDARVGEVSGAWCPGDYSVNCAGRFKLAGIGQRLVRGAAYAGGVLVVSDAARARQVFAPVYQALGYDYEPASTGSVADAVGGVDLETVRQVLLDELAAERSLAQGEIGDAALAQAAVFEPTYKLP